MRLRVGLPLWACTVLLGCGPDAPLQEDRAARPVVYGDDDRLEYYAHPDPTLRARAIESTVALIRPGRIDDSNPDDLRIDHRTLGVDEELCPGEPFADQQVGASCSGTLVGWDLVMTAGHCVDDLADCQDLWFVFDHLYEAPGQLATIGPQDVFQCRRLVARRDSGGIDYAFVQLDRPVGPPRRPAPVSRASLPLVEGSSVAVVGFPDGIPAKLDSGGFVLWDGAPDYEEFEATLDTFGGNSGSGVYDPSRTVVGILSRGETDYVQQGQCYVINRLPPTGDQGDAEGVAYVSHALTGLCATGWRGPLCGDLDGACQACATDAVCPEGWGCRAASTDPAITWCAAPCGVDADCPADHICVGGACDPALAKTCVGRSVHELNACGRIGAEVELCLGPAEVCDAGECRGADPGNSCLDPVPIEAVDQVLTGSVGVGLSNEHEGSCGGEGAERVFALDVPSAARVVATSEGYDTVLYLRSSCDRSATERACSDDDDPPGRRGSQIDVTLAPGRYYLFLDAYGARTGDYTLTLEVTELAPPDAGVEPDAGEVVQDAGQAAPDAGTVPDATVASDASVAPDAGEGVGEDEGGCGCTSAKGAPRGGVWGLWAVIALAVCRRRRG